MVNPGGVVGSYCRRIHKKKKKRRQGYISNPLPPQKQQRCCGRTDLLPLLTQLKCQRCQGGPDLSLSHPRSRQLNSARHWCPKPPPGNVAAAAPPLCQITPERISPGNRVAGCGSKVLVDLQAIRRKIVGRLPKWRRSL